MSTILSPNTKLAHYTIICKIGAVGMGEVYKARHEGLNRDVAIKVLPSGFERDEERLMRFKREAQVLASLNHPNIGEPATFLTVAISPDGKRTQAKVIGSDGHLNIWIYDLARGIGTRLTSGQLISHSLRGLQMGGSLAEISSR